jgi:diaminohydroxyphosphoribosylaminopyrimidine deaminase/5-amino-6-(5-phosphoribosylamino)uracil reductase
MAGKKRQSNSVDLKWMDRALDLAELGRYTVSPNPMVGAVLVRAGRVIGEAFHRRAGGHHAEAAALARAGSRAQGADLYVTLEPCAHFGRTPPCADAIVEAGVSRVIVGSGDPHSLVRGRGLRRLSRAGVEVLSADAARRRRAEEQNERFRTWADERRPFVLAKWASSLDGRIATSRGESRWITGSAPRRRALLLREEYDAVLVGAGTVLADDPRLTRRLGRNKTTPWRIVLDGRLRAPEGARLFREPGNRVVLTALPESHPRARRLALRGVEVWSFPSRRQGRVDLRRAAAAMARREITSVLVEGGAETLGSFFDAGLVDRVAVFIAPRILGGAAALAAVGGRGSTLASSPRVRDVRVESVGEDWLFTGRVVRKPD